MRNLIDYKSTFLLDTFFKTTNIFKKTQKTTNHKGKTKVHDAWSTSKLERELDETIPKDLPTQPVLGQKNAYVTRKAVSSLARFLNACLECGNSFQYTDREFFPSKRTHNHVSRLSASEYLLQILPTNLAGLGVSN